MHGTLCHTFMNRYVYHTEGLGDETEPICVQGALASYPGPRPFYMWPRYEAIGGDLAIVVHACYVSESTH